MRISRWPWLALALGLVGGAVVAVLASPRRRARLSWALTSMVRPADRAGVRLQR